MCLTLLGAMTNISKKPQSWLSQCINSERGSQHPRGPVGRHQVGGRQVGESVDKGTQIFLVLKSQPVQSTGWTPKEGRRVFHMLADLKGRRRGDAQLDSHSIRLLSVCCVPDTASAFPTFTGHGNVAPGFSAGRKLPLPPFSSPLICPALALPPTMSSLACGTSSGSE